MFIEIKKHPGVFNDRFKAIENSFRLGVNLIQRLWIGKEVLYEYHDQLYRTENEAQNEAEGVAHQQVLQDPEKKFSPIFEQEHQRVKKIEVDMLLFHMIGSKEDFTFRLYFNHEGNEEFQRIIQIIEQNTIK